MDVERPDTSIPFDDGRIWGVSVGLQRINGLGGFSQRHESVPVLPSSRTWRSLPLTQLLGFPIQSSSSPDEATMPNPIAQTLDVVIDPHSRNFGLPTTSRPMGTVLFTRTDGKDMNDDQLDTLQIYVSKHLEPVWQCIHNATSQEDFDRFQSIASKRMKPEAFHTFFDGYRRQQIAIAMAELEAHGGSDLECETLLTQWRRTKSPVSITLGDEISPGCGTCFGTVSNEGTALVKCAGCRERWYCNKHCQKHERKEHKVWCGKNLEA